MYQGYQPVIQQIESIGLTTAAQTITTKLNKLQEDLGRQHQHLIALIFEIDVTTLTTSGGTVSPDELNLLLDNIEINDGHQPRFNGSGRDLFAFERIESGFRRFAEPITTASGSTMQLRRVWSVGPPRMGGAPSDFAIPNAMLKKGFVKIKVAAAVTAESTITAFVAQLRIAAVCVAMDEMRIPPFVERRVVPVSAEETIVGERLVLFAAYGNDAAWGAIAAGDFAAITLKTGKAEMLSAVDASLINAAYNHDMAAGQLGGNIGDPRSAADVAAREVNPGTPTALQASAAIHQPIVYCQPSGRLTKVPTRIESNMIVKYTGANTGSVLALTSCLPQTPENIDTFAKEISTATGQSWKLKLKTTGTNKAKNSDVRYLPYVLEAA